MKKILFSLLLTVSFVISAQQMEPKSQSLLTTAEQKQAIEQFIDLQNAINNKDIKVLLNYLEPSAVYTGYLLFGDSSLSDDCDTTVNLPEINQSILQKCPAIWDNLKEIQSVKADAKQLMLSAQSTLETHEYCGIDFVVRFTTQQDLMPDEKTVAAPGIYLSVNHFTNSDLDEKVDACVWGKRYYFKFTKKQLKLVTIQELP